jgi:hypothetical protein
MIEVAQRRGVVRLPDGRTGRLIYWPIAPDKRRAPRGRGKGGARAKVQLPSGAVVTVAVDGLIEVDDDV